MDKFKLYLATGIVAVTVLFIAVSAVCLATVGIMRLAELLN